jgi:hypothetical protein
MGQFSRRPDHLSRLILEPDDHEIADRVTETTAPCNGVETGQSGGLGASLRAPGGHSCATHSRNPGDTGGHERTRRARRLSTGGQWTTTTARGLKTGRDPLFVARANYWIRGHCQEPSRGTLMADASLSTPPVSNWSAPRRRRT